MTTKQGNLVRPESPVWSRQMLEAAPVALAVLSCERPFAILGANAECRRIMGGDIAGAPFPSVVLCESPGEDAALARVLEDGSGELLSLSVSRRDGGRFPAELRLRRVPDSDPAVAVVSICDVGANAAREAELRRAWEDSERAMRGKMRFFAAASHDLRQPLQALALFVSALGSHVRGEAAETILQAIKTSLRSMEDMFDSLLDMSRLDAGVLKAEPTAFLIGDILEDLETEFRPQCESQGLSLRVIPSSAEVVSDPRLLARILRNFLSNAVRYTRRGGILLGCRRRGDVLRIEVWDTGPGIPEHQRLAIFDEFYRADSAGSGSGLGLAIVQRLARLLRHRLDVCCVEGKGTMFSVEVARGSTDLVEARADADGDETVEADLGGITVAVVEDDPDVLGALVMILEEWGCRVAGATTAAEAASRLQSDGLRPDIILADLRLRHNQSGLQAIAVLQALAGREIPAFVFTGDTEPAADLPYPILRKPLNPLKLREILADTVGRS